MSKYNWMALEELTPRQAWDKLCDADTRLAVAIALEKALEDADTMGHLKTDSEQIELIIPMLVRDAREDLADVFCDIELKPNGQKENPH